MESGIQLKESGIPLTIGIQNVRSTAKVWNPESTAWNLESKTVLDSLTWDAEAWAGVENICVSRLYAEVRQFHELRTKGNV